MFYIYYKHILYLFIWPLEQHAVCFYYSKSYLIFSVISESDYIMNLDISLGFGKCQRAGGTVTAAAFK